MIDQSFSSNCLFVIHLCVVKRLKKQVYISMNLPPVQSELALAVERRLVEEIVRNPDAF